MNGRGLCEDCCKSKVSSKDGTGLCAGCREDSLLYQTPKVCAMCGAKSPTLALSHSCMFCIHPCRIVELNRVVNA